MDTITIEDKARQLLEEHAGPGWKFRWDKRSVRRVGACRFQTKTITISSKFLPHLSDTQVMETILHEVGHAVAGHSAGHGPLWRMAVRRIGGNPNRTLAVDVPDEHYAWVGTCRAGHTVRRHRLTEKAKRVSCARCSPVWDAANKYTWTRNK